MKPEVLTVDSQGDPPRRTSVWRFLLQPESLPYDPEIPRSATGGVLKFLVASDDLGPSDPL